MKPSTPPQTFHALFGGSFDPPHLGHALVVQTLLESPYVERISIIPASDARYDKKPKASFFHRCEMLKLFKEELFKPNRQVDVLDIQNTQASLAASRTLDTVQYLSRLSPQTHFAWVIGEDNLSSISNWYGAEQLMSLVTFLVLRRMGVSAPGKNLNLQAKIIYLPQTSVSEASSSEIREKIKSGQSIFSLVSPEVLRYITSSSLYLEK